MILKKLILPPVFTPAKKKDFYCCKRQNFSKNLILSEPVLTSLKPYLMYKNHRHFENEKQRQYDDWDERLATAIAIGIVSVLIICLIFENLLS